jgi:hypothetical protein
VLSTRQFPDLPQRPQQSTCWDSLRAGSRSSPPPLGTGARDPHIWLSSPRISFVACHTPRWATASSRSRHADAALSRPLPSISQTRRSPARCCFLLLLAAASASVVATCLPLSLLLLLPSGRRRRRLAVARGGLALRPATATPLPTCRAAGRHGRRFVSFVCFFFRLLRFSSAFSLPLHHGSLPRFTLARHV